MLDEVRRSSELYRPSHFWDHYGRQNALMLAEHGFENLKRTLAQNYYNWLVTSFDNNQLCNVLRYWRGHPTVRPLLNRIEPITALHATSGEERRVIHFGPKERFLYKLFVGCLWELALATDRTGIAAGIQEPLIGNPIRIWRKGRLISQDLANSVREYNSMLEASPGMRLSPQNVAELGAGYGRLAYVMLQDPGIRYFVFDLPPALAASQWYLSKVFGGEKMFHFRHIASYSEIETELARCRVGFFTPNQIELFPDGYFSAFASISTLPEMTQAQVHNYLQLMSAKTSRLVYIKQWKSWTNPYDNYHFAQQDIHLTHGFRKAIARDDAIQNAFFECAWVR